MRIKASLNPDSRRIKVHLCDNEDNALVWAGRVGHNRRTCPRKKVA